MIYEICAPATLSNFGPGFDTLGMAINRYLKVKFECGGGVKDYRLIHEGEYPVPGEADNLIFKMLREYYKKPFKLSVKNDIPLKRGLGSSSAALVCALGLIKILKMEAAGEINPEMDRASLAEIVKHSIYNQAVAREGHPDNVTPCLFGGFVTARVDKKEGSFLNIPFPSYIKLHIIIPALETETKMAREILPNNYKLADAVTNLQNLSFMVADFCLNSNNSEKKPIFYGLKNLFADRLHQDYRLKLCPSCGDAILVLNESDKIMGAFLSGSGTSVCALADAEGDPDKFKNALHIFEAQNIEARYITHDIDYNGLRIL
jgi:homoserine kinase